MKYFSSQTLCELIAKFSIILIIILIAKIVHKKFCHKFFLLKLHYFSIKTISYPNNVPMFITDKTSQ